MNWLTADLPSIGGAYKLCPEDFFVEEIPLYPCIGQGEHLYLLVEKRALTTTEMLRQIGACLNIPEREIGYAGLKDAQAITRQWISVPSHCERNLSALERLSIRILESSRHSNKLRLGHLLGNRFRIRVRETGPHARQRADSILKQLSERGVPNLFGEQRYGVLGNSHILGHLLLSGDYSGFCREFIGAPHTIKNTEWKKAAEFFHAGDLSSAAQNLPIRMRDEKQLITMLLRGQTPRAAVLTLPKRLLRLYLSALQSGLFDLLLNRRLPDLGQLLEGDLAIKHANGACFPVQDLSAEQARADDFEISPTAPLFGSKTRLAEGLQGRQERQLLARLKLRPDSWKLGQGLTMTGDRRALRVPISTTSVSEIGRDLLLDFCLPRGSYATSVLNELIKKEPETSRPLLPPESD